MRLSRVRPAYVTADHRIVPAEAIPDELMRIEVLDLEVTGYQMSPVAGFEPFTHVIRPASDAGTPSRAYLAEFGPG